jgi:hypothetical protein
MTILLLKFPGRFIDSFKYVDKFADHHGFFGLITRISKSI